MFLIPIWFLIISITTIFSKILVFLEWIKMEKLTYQLTMVWKNDQNLRPFKWKIGSRGGLSFCVCFVPSTRAYSGQEEWLGLDTAEHLNSYALLIYAENAHNFLGFLAQKVTLMFYLLMQKKGACLSSVLSLISMEFLKVLRNELHRSVCLVLSWHEILKCYWCPWVLPAI